MKNILFAASEAVPFIKTGGLADVVGSLPKCFDKEYFDVRVICPNYACIKKEYKDMMEYKTHFYMSLGWRNQYVGVLEAVMDGVTFYFIDNEYYFAGPKPYGHIHEDVEKFAFFSKAVLSVLPSLGFKPDVIHCHDWQTGLIPVFLDAGFRESDFYQDIRTVLTIHNLKFQGIWSRDMIQDITGLSDEYFTDDKLGVYCSDNANYLKGGIVFADAITTVSKTYAEEIKTEFYGENLDYLLCERQESLRGIVNGIDYEVYNPEDDIFLEKTYNIGNFRKEKSKNKTALQKQLGLEVDNKKFMIGVVSRLTDQKGINLIAYIMDELCQDDIQFVVLGTGEEKYENMFRYFQWKYPDKVSANICYSDELSHKIYGACDALLMPSLFEPCGLSQLMSLRYGTIPIVRETGGLKDTVEPYNEYEHTGTGFSFANYNAHEMLGIIRYAESVYYKNKRQWNKIVDRAMTADFSWEASAAQYTEMYDWLVQWKLEI